MDERFMEAQPRDLDESFLMEVLVLVVRIYSSLLDMDSKPCLPPCLLSFTSSILILLLALCALLLDVEELKNTTNSLFFELSYLVACLVSSSRPTVV